MTTATSSLEPRAVSAPGKVLLAGGYLVLDRGYTGLVFGLDARIHVYIEPIRTNSGVILSEIIVKSPQFQEAVWEYGYRLKENDGGIAVTQLRASHDLPLTRNPFIETALAYALTYITATLPHLPIHASSISILADKSYYSNTSALPPTSRFHNFKEPLFDAHKTGLGSSAALVTSFTAALLTHYLPKELFDLGDEKSLTVLYNLAQASHCAAQGKVGSGFDVASAVYGSCLYRRFSPSLLEGYGEPGSPNFSTRLKHLIDEQAWDTEIHKSAIKVPSSLRLVMCDVDCGSKTPGMVKQVLQWRTSDPEKATQIWNALQTANEAFAAELTCLATSDTQNGDAGEKYTVLKRKILEIRSLIRQMSLASRVAIEPPQQTALLDACSALPGVIGGVVPGAGGYDAVAVLVENKEEVVEELKKLLSGWKVDRGEDAADGVKIGKVEMLDVREEMVGVRLEDPGIYKEWMDY
ncbi:Phosphomevalonate kinase [Zopfia rhizophila CBS 207.26]|uniref:Phosphomevalonate kinase n=1 Tax=Zopfia rhizophila CBS 207.26 TaxID=1314779 RepID=A0A6A6EI59_9PEZI|nr:Phosphomevalonate kinase [Zopfia rhizophila CBS 207.26]